MFRAFLQFYNRQPSQTELDAFRVGVAEMESRAGARWLKHESTQNVLQLVRPSAEVLREIKAEQDRVREVANAEVKAT